MVNTQLLDECIKESGLKINYLCKSLGISRSAFDRKRKNKSLFKPPEVKMLAGLLNIADADKEEQIFLP